MELMHEMDMDGMCFTLSAYAMNIFYPNLMVLIRCIIAYLSTLN